MSCARAGSGVAGMGTTGTCSGTRLSTGRALAEVSGIGETAGVGLAGSLAWRVVNHRITMSSTNPPPINATSGCLTFLLGRGDGGVDDGRSESLAMRVSANQGGPLSASTNYGRRAQARLPQSSQNDLMGRWCTSVSGRAL